MGPLLILAATVAIGALHLHTRGRFGDDLAGVDRGEYPLKDLLPMGLWLADHLESRLSGRYTRTVNGRMLELYGASRARFYVRLHRANRFTYLLIGAFFGTLLAAGADSPSEGLLSALVLLGAVCVLPDVDLKNRVAKRRLSIQVDFPEFLNKLTLLVDAGLPVSGAWSRIVEESRGRRDRPLYRELEEVYLQIRAGKSELSAYEAFAKRCRMLEVTKFTAILLMTVRKGSGELLVSLKSLSEECWQARVHLARRQGEEAGTRLLFPMMMMLIGVMIIVIIPVILEFQNI